MNMSAKITDNPYGFTDESQFTEADNLIYLHARVKRATAGRIPKNHCGVVSIHARVKRATV